MDTFNPPVPPSYDSDGIQETPRVLSVSFGDGYKQEAADGLNANDATASFVWDFLTEAQASYIAGFYNTHIGKTFYWNAPADFIGSGKWRFSSGIKIVPVGFNWYSISISFERSFELNPYANLVMTSAMFAQWMSTLPTADPLIQNTVWNNSLIPNLSSAGISNIPYAPLQVTTNDMARFIKTLPTADPDIAGQAWNNSGSLAMSSSGFGDVSSYTGNNLTTAAWVAWISQLPATSTSSTGWSQNAGTVFFGG